MVDKFNGNFSFCGQGGVSFGCFDVAQDLYALLPFLMPFLLRLDNHGVPAETLSISNLDKLFQLHLQLLF
jgi:hypothetical protein